MRKVTTVALALLLVPGISQAKTLEELLVEKGVVSESDLRSGTHHGGAKVYWKKGSRLEFPDNGFTAQINTQLQPRYEYTDNDDAENTSSFTLERARIEVEGTVLNSEFAYRISNDFTDNPGIDGSGLLDAYIEWSPCDTGGLRMGQFRSAIGRQFLNTPDRLQFADRSVVTDAFALGFQTGVAGHTSLADGNVTLQGQFFNGESDGEGRNLPGVDTNHTAVVSARANLLGEIDSLTEGDIDWTDELAMDVGAAFAFSDKTVGGVDYDDQTLSADFNVKASGASLHGEFFWRDEDATDAEPMGFYAQAGYFFMPKTFEVAVRGSYLDCDDGLAETGNCAGNDDISSAEVSLNYFFWKHYLKAQLGYAFVQESPTDNGEDIESNRVVFQVSSYF